MVINALTTESERRDDPRKGGSERKCKRNVEAAQQLKVQVPGLLFLLLRCRCCCGGSVVVVVI